MENKLKKRKSAGLVKKEIKKEESQIPTRRSGRNRNVQRETLDDDSDDGSFIASDDDTD